MVLRTSRLPDPTDVKDGNVQSYLTALVRTLRDNFVAINAQHSSTSTGTITLAINTNSTLVQDLNVVPNSVVLLQATTANAATEIASGNFYVVVNKGSFFIFHTNSSTTFRTFDYVVNN